jgi:Dockerin type I domain
VNADQWISPIDALLVINQLNARGVDAKGEGEAAQDAWFAELGERPREDFWQLLDPDLLPNRPKRR